MKAAFALVVAVLAGCQASRPAARERVNDRMLDIAGPTLSALQAKMDVCGHNLANAQTAGFKATRVVLQDLPYTDAADGQVRVGHGVRIASARLDMGQGSFSQTSRPMDVAIEGAGFFKVRRADGGVAYTRAGNFMRNADGEIAIAGDLLACLEPRITLPSDSVSVTISSSGAVFVIQPGSASPSEIGQIQLTRFVSPENLRSIGGCMYVETSASGAPIEGQPGNDAFGNLHQGMLEASNVDLVFEAVESRRTLSLYNAFRDACMGHPSLPLAAAPSEH